METMDNNRKQCAIMDKNGQQSVVLHASLMPFLLVYCYKHFISEVIKYDKNDNMTKKTNMTNIR